MVAPNNEQVRYDILIEAKQAIKNLRDIMKATEDNTTKMQLFSALVLDSAEKWKMSWQQALMVYKQLNAELTKQKKGSLFGQTGGQDIAEMSRQYLQAAENSGRLVTSVEQVSKASKNMGDTVESSTRRATRGIDAMRIALGVLVSMLIFQVMAAVQNAFRTFIHNLRETELAVYNLINAERRLSEEGIDVTPKGLEETIKAVNQLVPILSKIQAEELVSRIATNVAPALKLTNEQIRQMAEATALLYVRNKALGKSFDEVEAQLTNAFLTGKVSQGINNLGVKITDQIVRDEALRMGLVETADEFDNLTGEMEAQVKASAMLSVVYKNASEDIGSLGEYMQTTDAQIERASTAWDNLLSALGGSGAGNWLAKAIGFAAGILEAWVEIIEFLTPLMQQFFATSIAGFMSLGYVMQHPLTGIVEFRKKFLEFKALALEDMMVELGDAVDTPTAAIENLGEAVESVDFEDFKNKIEDIIEATANAREDLARNLDRKLTDLDEEYRRKAEDAERDYLRKVEDINREAEEDIRDIKEKQREDDLRAEEKYQLALWELRMRFLMDLEDALHARDARQVLRLQRQYAFDKEALARKHALDTKSREDDQKAELDAANDKKQQRLEDAKREYEEKLADQRIAKQRELEDLNIWYAREQADIDAAQQRKMESLIKGWIDEKKITSDNAAEVYGILKSYFGPGGMTDALYQYMAQSLAASTINAVNGVMSQLSGIKGGGIGGGGMTQPITSGGRVSRARTDSRPIPQFAEGGSLLATRPTTATFGEGGPELVNFTPLSRVGKNVGKLFGDTSGGGGLNGTIRVAVDLSPDLTGRIVEQSMDGVAEILSQVNRSKV